MREKAEEEEEAQEEEEKKKKKKWRRRRPPRRYCVGNWRRRTVRKVKPVQLPNETRMVH